MSCYTCLNSIYIVYESHRCLIYLLQLSSEELVSLTLLPHFQFASVLEHFNLTGEPQVSCFIELLYLLWFIEGALTHPYLLYAQRVRSGFLLGSCASVLLNSVRLSFGQTILLRGTGNS